MNTFSKFRAGLVEKTLTPAEKKKREEVAQAIEREHPGMPMGMKMAIATKTAKRVAESEQIDELKKSTIRSYANKKQAELDDVPPMPFKKPAMSKAEHEKAAKGMMGALARLSGKKPTSEETELEEARGLAGMSMDQLKQEHEKVKSKIESEGKSKMISMNHPLSQRARAIRLHMAIKAGKKTNEDVESEEDQHLCAKHVRSALLGDGVVLEAQHADPDENGQIEWYMVEFRDGIHKVFTEDLEIMLAEYHGNHKKKRMTNG